jgi:uncharacterized protein (DUF433 family)
MENIYREALPMLTQKHTFFTAAEAAALTRLSLKAVNNAIDKRTITARVTKRRGSKAARLVGEPALVYLCLERKLMEDTTPLFRRRLFEAIAVAWAKGVSSVSLGPLTLDFRPSWREVTERIKDLRRAERLVEVDAEVLGGVPVFRATRIPIHTVAELLSEGETPERLRNGYPRLTEEMVRLAPIYAGAHPLRGRPRKRPWRGRAKKSMFRVPLGDTVTP